MNVVRNKKRQSRGRPVCIRANDNDGLIGLQKNPEKVINMKILNEISCDFNGGTTTTVKSSDDPQIIIAITEGRGHASGEVGIASIDLSSPALILTQISDNVWYTDTLTKIQILNPVKILVPDTIFECHPLPKLIMFIKESFSQIQMIPIQRKHFNDTNALELIKLYCSMKSNNIQQIIARKYYALSASSALLTYLKTINMLAFGKKSLKLDYQAKHGGMLIDTATSIRLELLYSTSIDPDSRQFSLFYILNKCVTKIGQRHLRANILEPSCNIKFIQKRQEQIKTLIEKPELMMLLKESLAVFINIDKLLKISYIVPQDDCEKAIQTHIALALTLKSCMESVTPLADVLESIDSEFFQDMKNILNLNIYKEIIDKINEVVQPDIHVKRMARKHFQYLYAVKGNVNETIDFFRQLYSDVIDKIRDHITELSEQTNLPIKMIHSAKLGYHIFLKKSVEHEIPRDFELIYSKGFNYYLTTPNLLALNESTQKIGIDIIKLSNSILCDMLIEIAQEIDAIYHLIGIVIDLDIIQSLAEVSAAHQYCCPRFGKVLKLDDAYHPMLDFKRDKTLTIKNNVIATAQYNFTLLNGPNMSGKTIYIKMIAIIQIMAQIGCFVPATSADIRLTDKLFSRLTFQDNFEQNASSFTIELREMEYIYLNLSPNSLVIIDELCRSTNHQEGEVLCWKYCEKLLEFIGISDDKYFEYKNNELNEDSDTSEEVLGHESRQDSSSLKIDGKSIKLRDITRPFFFVTTHFNSTTKLIKQYNNIVNLHMKVDRKMVDGKSRLDFKYKIQYGPSKVKSYGLALARCMRFPESLLNRAEALVDEISEDAMNEFVNTTINNNRSRSSNESRNANQMDTSENSKSFNQTILSTEITNVEREIFDMYSYITLLMNNHETGSDGENFANMQAINDKIAGLIEMMSTEFLDIVNKSSIGDIISAINNSTTSDSSHNSSS